MSSTFIQELTAEEHSDLVVDWLTCRAFQQTGTELKPRLTFTEKLLAPRSDLYLLFFFFNSPVNDVLVQLRTGRDVRRVLALRSHALLVKYIINNFKYNIISMPRAPGQQRPSLGFSVETPRVRPVSQGRNAFFWSAERWHYLKDSHYIKPTQQNRKSGTFSRCEPTRPYSSFWLLCKTSEKKWSWSEGTARVKTIYIHIFTWQTMWLPFVEQWKI